MSDEFYYGSIMVMAIIGIAYAYYSHKNNPNNSIPN